MPATVTCMPDEPIVIAEFQGRMDLESVRTVFQASARCADALDSRLFRIVNYLHVEASFRDMAAALAEGSKGGSGSLRDPRIQEVMVAGRNRIRFLLDILRRKEYGSIDVPVFDTMDEALAFVRAQLRCGALDSSEARV